MKSITELLKDAGVTIPDDKTEAFNKDFAANYKTIADYDNQKAAAKKAQDDIKAQLDGVQAKLKEFEGVDVEKLKGEITKLSGDLKTAQDNHAAEIAKRDRQAETKDFLGGYKFINQETKDHYAAKLDAALEDKANTGKNRKDILDALTAGEGGKPRANIFAEELPTTPMYPAGTGTMQMIGGVKPWLISIVTGVTFSIPTAVRVSVAVRASVPSFFAKVTDIVPSPVPEVGETVA